MVNDDAIIIGDADTSNASNSIISVGDDIAIIRVALDMTQKEFANAISVSRATINRIERGGAISSDIAFRIYYAMQKIMENRYIDEVIKKKSLNLQKSIELNYILRKGKFNAIAYSEK